MQQLACKMEIYKVWPLTRACPDSTAFEILHNQTLSSPRADQACICSLFWMLTADLHLVAGFMKGPLKHNVTDKLYSAKGHMQSTLLCSAVLNTAWSVLFTVRTGVCSSLIKQQIAQTLISLCIMHRLIRVFALCKSHGNFSVCRSSSNVSDIIDLSSCWSDPTTSLWAD